MSLQLENTVFTSVTVEANPKFQPREDRSVPLPCDLGLDVEINVISETRIGIRLVISLEPSDDLPYEIDLHLFGGSTLDPGEMADWAKRGIFDACMQTHKSSLLGMLYSSAREFVLLVTGRQPWGPFVLPTIHPADIKMEVTLSDEVQQLISTTSPKARKPTPGKKTKAPSAAKKAR